jgi:hypothetical protein
MKIAILPGDGIGTEIVAEAIKVLKALDLSFTMESAPVGGAAYESHGHPLPDSTLQLAKDADAILFGAVALALSLSFGLGNRELAGEVTREWYQRYQVERRAIDAEAAADEAEELAEETSEDETAEMPMPESPVAAMTPVTVNGRPLDERTP